MRFIPTSCQAWGSFLLLLFKAYSVIALVVFLSVCSHFNPPSSAYSHIGGWIIISYLVAAPVLLVGGLVEMIFLKSKSGVWSFVFGIADVGLLVVLPGFFLSK
jgi:hypothetical protein